MANGFIKDSFLIGDNFKMLTNTASTLIDYVSNIYKSMNTYTDIQTDIQKDGRTKPNELA